MPPKSCLKTGCKLLAVSASNYCAQHRPSDFSPRGRLGIRVMKGAKRKAAKKK